MRAGTPRRDPRVRATSASDPVHSLTPPGEIPGPMLSWIAAMAALIKIDHSSSVAAERARAARFCSRCGTPADEVSDERPLPQTRVCEGCGMGMLLSCVRAALPGAGAAFMIVTADLRINAVSQAAEVLFDTEEALLGEPLLSVISSPLGEEQFARAVGRAAVRVQEPIHLTVRGLKPRARAAGLLAAHVSTCGSPRAALVKVEPSRLERL